MERSKRSQSPVVRWALELAIEGATPAVTRAGVSQHAPSCPDLPRELLKMQNEPKSFPPRGRVVGPGARVDASPAALKGAAGSKLCPELPRNAPTCPTNLAPRNDRLRKTNPIPRTRRPATAPTQTCPRASSRPSSCCSAAVRTAAWCGN